MDDDTSVEVTLGEVLSVFESVGPGEPLTSVEVSDAVGCTRRTAYNRLQTLESRGDLRTKKVGARGRVWWREPTAGDDSTRPETGTDPEVQSGRVIEVELRSEALAEAFAGVEPASGSLRFEVEHDLRLPDGRRLQYYTVTGVSPRAFAEAFERFPSIESVRLLSTVGDVSRLEAVVEPRSVSEVIRHFGGQTKSAGVRNGEHWVIAELPASTDTDAVAVAIREVYDDMRLVATQYVPTVSDFWTVVASDLTERQRTVLRLAYHAGYFESPRQSTGQELADRLDITRQTLNQHLRGAENAVFEWLFEPVPPSASDQ